MVAPRADLGGIHAVLYALFDEAEQTDLGAMRAQAQLMVELGMHGVTVLGLATEVQKLSEHERVDIIRAVAKDVVGHVPFSVTLTGNNIAEQRRIATCAVQEGAEFLILQPPSVGSFSSQEYIDFFLRVADGFDVRFGIQNAPQYLGRALNHQDILDLRASNHLFDVIKAEAPPLDLAKLAQAAGGGLTLLNGRGGLEMTDCLRSGANGFILAPDAIDLARSCYAHWVSGEIELAEADHATALPAIQFVMQSIEHLICYGKRLFGLRAGFAIHDRGPCLRPNETGLHLTKLWADRLGPLSIENS
ncbi:MAG: dihydrodipicolinate synthase family protein [Marinosulfonomonas sp.]